MLESRPSRPLLALVGLLALAGCTPSEAADAGPPGVCTFHLSLEVEDASARFVPLTDAESSAWLIRGFQGFRFILLRARFDAPPVERSGAVRITVDGMAERSQPLGALNLEADGGGYLSDPFPVFFNDDPLASIAGRGCTLAVTIGAASCAASAAGRVSLHWDESCVQDPDGGIDCARDAGASD
jgi:hypothetical protein